MSILLTEHDIRSFLKEAPQTGKILKNIGMAVTSVVALGLAGYVLLNLQSLLYINDVAPLSNTEAQAASEALPEATPEPTPAVEPTVQAIVEYPTIPENTVAYSALGISAPIYWNVQLGSKDEAKLLPNGVIHIAGTALPGEKGMAAISGHSSNYPWIKGGFNTVFAPLTRSVAGGQIEINYQNKLYRYTVTKVYEVKPTQVDILQDHSKSGLRLITCTPVGTSLRRLVVEADQVYPDPAQNTDFNPAAFSGQLPNDR